MLANPIRSIGFAIESTTSRDWLFFRVVLLMSFTGLFHRRGIFTGNPPCAPETKNALLVLSNRCGGPATNIYHALKNFSCKNWKSLQSVLFSTTFFYLSTFSGIIVACFKSVGSGFLFRDLIKCSFYTFGDKKPQDVQLHCYTCCRCDG